MWITYFHVNFCILLGFAFSYASHGPTSALYCWTSIKTLLDNPQRTVAGGSAKDKWCITCCYGKMNTHLICISCYPLMYKISLCLEGRFFYKHSWILNFFTMSFLIKLSFSLYKFPKINGVHGDFFLYAYDIFWSYLLFNALWESLSPIHLAFSTPFTVLVPIVPFSFQSLDTTYREKCAAFIFRFYIILFNLTIFNSSHFSANDIFFIFMAK